MPRSAAALSLAAPFGLVFYFADGRCARANGVLDALALDAAAETWLEERAHDALRTGEPLLGAAHAQLRASFYPVHEAGRTVGVAVTVEDDSERSRAQAGLQLLADAGAVLESSLRAGERLEMLVAMLVDDYAEACVVELLQRGRLRTAAVAHRDPGAAHALRERHDRDPIPDAVRMGCVERTTRRISAPLLARDRVLGVLTLLRGDRDQDFDDVDLAFVEEVASRAALAVDNALLLEQQTEIAQTLQRSLLPPHLPAIPGVELAALYRVGSAGIEVGGDFYDVFPTRGGWTGTIGDACGKGAAAASVPALARHTIRALAFEAETPGEVLHGVNDRLARQPDGEALLTAALVKLVPGRDELKVTVACAGHPPPFVVRADGAVEELGRPGTMLGPFAREAIFEDVSTVLRPTDALVLYTDGVTEARRDGSLFGEARLRAVLHDSAGWPAHRMADAIQSAVEDFGGAPDDDMALLVASAAHASRLRQ